MLVLLGILVVVAGITLSYLATNLFRQRHGVKSKYNVMDHPTLKESTESGWAMGEKPVMFDLEGIVTMIFIGADGAANVNISKH